MGMRTYLLTCIVFLADVLVQEANGDKKNIPKPIINSLHINSDIKFTYAKTLVSSRILNPADVAQEVHFSVVLPEEAFITGLIMTIKNKSYEAYVKGKEDAKKEYDAAVSAGRSAAHVSQDSRFSKDFTVSLNVEPEEKVNFNLTYEELLSRRNKTYKNEIHVNPNQIVDDLSVVVNIEDLLEIINVHVPQFTMNNDLSASEAENSAVKITSAPHKVKVEWKPTVDEQKQLSKEGLNGKMIVKYDVDSSKNPHQILVDSDGYFLHILRNDNLPTLNKHVVFVLDVSGSMSGKKISQLKEALRKILLDLSQSDYFSIVLFSDGIVAWGPDYQVDFHNLWRSNKQFDITENEGLIVLANEQNVKSALNFTESLSTYGGTNIMGGLRNGLKLAKLGQKINKNSAHPVESMIIFLTDGQPNTEESNPDKIIDNAGSLNNGVTIFSLGFGFDAEMDFLKKLSLVNHGIARRIYEDSDAPLQLQNFYKEIASPVLADIKFKYIQDQVEDVTSKEFKNLFSGSELLVLGKMKPNGTLSSSLEANTWNGTQKYEIPSDQIIVLPPCCKDTPNKTFGHLEKMWAYKTIKTLLDKNTVSKENATENRAKELALKYSFVTPLTSLVVVKPNNSAVVNDEESKRAVDRSGSPGFALHSVSFAVKSWGGARSSLAAPAPVHADRVFMSSMPNYMLSLNHPPNKVVISSMPSYMVSYQRPLILDTTADLYGPTTDLYVSTTPSAGHTLIPYQNITWLNLTASAEGFLTPPSSLQTSDVIALNKANNTNAKCPNGNDCRHFIYCTLAEFADDISKFIPFQCHIEDKFLGVCCPL